MLLILFIIHSYSYSYVLADHSYTMNGYKLKDFPNFSTEWKFVTVRYRKDTGEMRFTYANDIAWKHLNSNSTNYPQGSVFAKISIRTQVDDAFPSSVVPSGGRRIQFMVRDQNKHKRTGGWGYALFDLNGKRTPGDPVAKSMACAACHALVKDRGQVFSSPMAFIGFSPKQRPQEMKWLKRLKFIEKEISTLPPDLRKNLSGYSGKIRTISGSLTKNLFEGTLDEIRPILIVETIRSGLGSALISEDGKQFSVVLPNQDQNCTLANQISLKAFHTVPNLKKPIYVVSICENKKDYSF